MSELNVILLGPPGAGKGTQAERIQEDFPQIAYVSTGNMLRAHVADGTDLGKEAKSYMDSGGLVPDELVTKMALDRLDQDDTRDGVLLDGFPRKVTQAEALAGSGRKLSGVILIDVDDEEIVRRVSGRRVSKSGRVYHVDFDPPKHEGRCDVDGSTLIQREDDKPEVVRERLEVYHRDTSPLIAYYEDQGLLARIDGTRPPTEVHDHIRATIATWRLEEQL
ncbi:MAG: adenylate kinase [Baekduiaceae bacterium]